MTPTIKVTSVDHAKQVMDTIKSLAALEVYVGVPEAEATRTDPDINNAQLVFIHTNGSPLMGIPSRPLIEPAISDPANAARLASLLKDAIKSTLEGNKPEAINHLKATGMEAQNIVRAWFVSPNNNWPPNAPYTIKKKGSDRPLIDTGALRQSITYVISSEDLA